MALLNSPLDVKEQIRDRINIVDLVSKYIPLQRQGRNYVGRCPWHDDKRPSLQVNPERQTFKCWVCDIGGDIFSFIMKQQGVEFHEALEILAEEAGIELKPRKKNPSEYHTGLIPEESEDSRQSFVATSIGKRAIYSALDWLAGNYHEVFLHDPEAEPARQYIKERGMTDATIEQFRIGYAPVRNNFLLELIGYRRERVAVLEAAGVLVRKNNSRTPGKRPILEDWERHGYYDRFYGRVLFPICDISHKTVAFGGRMLPGSTSPAKYLNSPETAVFLKRKMLYGLDQAQFGLSGRALIMEGYTDCIMAHQFGFTEAVAVLGTALGPEHIRILKRMTKKLILVLDGDEAGRKRAAAVLKDFVQQGADMSVLTLPEGMGKDPCEFLLNNGRDAFEDLLETKTVDVLDHAFNIAVQGIDLENDIVASTNALNQMLSIVALFPTKADLNDPVRIRTEKMIQRLALRFRIGEDEIRKGIQEHRRNREQYERRDDYLSPAENYTGSEELPGRNQGQNQGQNQEGITTVSLHEQFVFPMLEESLTEEETIAIQFARFDRSIWSNSGLLPNELEKNYLEAWFGLPEMFREMETRINKELFRSPVVRQLNLLGCYLTDQGIIPDFKELILRYEDAEMKKFLIGIADSAESKHLDQRLKKDEFRERYMEEIQNGFERFKIEREEPKQISALREKDRDSDEKLSALVELRDLLVRKQQNLAGGSLFTEEEGPDSK